MEPAGLLRRNTEKIESFAHSLGLADIKELNYFPKFIQIETISICNGSCLICPIQEIKRDQRIMNSFLFTKVVKELHEYADWVERVTVQTLGEPLLDKDLENKILKLKQAGIKSISFTTNGSLLDESRSLTLLACGIDNIDFSIDGSTAEVFESIRRGLKFQEVVNNIKKFVQLRDNMRVPVSVRIRMTISDQNVHQFNEVKSFWAQVLGPGDRIYGKLLNSWTNWLDGYALPEEQDSDSLNFSPCVSPFGSFPIQSDGNVAICCQDFNAKESMGNLNYSTIKEIWQSSRYRGVRQAQLAHGRIAFKCCRDCNVWDESTIV